MRSDPAWVRSIAESENSPDVLGSRSEADLYHLFLERGLRVGAGRAHIRAGAGVARTESLVGSGSSLLSSRHARLSLAGSVGIDLGLGNHTYLTPTLGYSRILSADRTNMELSHGVLVGIALTLR